ncbi:unnamed protein product, partial [Staurois parvus]
EATLGLVHTIDSVGATPGETDKGYNSCCGCETKHCDMCTPLATWYLFHRLFSGRTDHLETRALPKGPGSVGDT